MIIQKERKAKGFTLVELVIVIAIVIILSTISMPIYRGYVDKSKMAEGYALLGTILSAQKAYYSEYGNFLRCQDSSVDSGQHTNYEPILGIDARGNKYFTCFKSGSTLDTAKYYFIADTNIPEDLQKNDDVALQLQYNITKGARIFFYPSGVDASWRE